MSGRGDADRPRASVVVATYNDLDRLRDCLASLANQEYPAAKMQVVVVDDGSTDGTAAAVRREHPEVVLISQPNAGAELARNAGVDASDGDVVAFIDSDCLAPPSWLARATDRLGEDHSLVVGGWVHHRGGFWERLTGIADFGEFQGARLLEVRTLPTCNMVLYRELFDQVRFDPRLAPNADTLFAAGLARRGAKLLYDPDVTVIHRPAADFGSLMGRARRYGRSFVAARRIDSGLRYGGLVRAGVPGVAVATLGRVLLDWCRVLRHRRRAGFRAIEVPAALGVLLIRRVLSLPSAVRAVLDPELRASRRKP